MDIVTLGAALNGSAEYVKSHFKGGSNIQIVDNPDGTQTINASGEVSSEDTVARAEIAAIKDGTNIDSFGDVESALGNKADSSTTYTKTEVDTALSGKQATLTTAQLAAANSGITSADVAQITTNKNNILSIYNTGFAQKNVMHIVLDEVKAILPSQSFVGNTTKFGNLSATFNEDNSITLNGSHTANVAINFKDLSHINMPTNAVGAASANITLSDDIFFGLWGNSGLSNLVLNDGVDIPSDYASKYSRGFIIRVSANTVCDNVRIYPMVCDKALYQASSEVVPYALSNVELTAKEQANENNISSEQAKTTGMSEGGSNYITVGGIRVYVSATAPTGARTGDLWIGG